MNVSIGSKKVVIIGGGPSAKHAAEQLAKKANSNLEVTVIQANRFVEWPLAMTVCLVKPELHNKAIATNCNKFQVPGVKYIYGVVESVDGQTKQVKLRQAVADAVCESVPYDALIVATGFKVPLVYPGLGVTIEERTAEVQKVGEAIKKGACIVVAGGGPIGLELVGDIRGEYPAKKVVLMCRGDVLGQWPEKQRKKVEARLQHMNIEVKKGATDAPKDYCLESGVIKFGNGDLEYDVFLPAFSQGPNTQFLPGEVLDANGCVEVNEYLQSTKMNDIFAIGVSNVKEITVFPKLEAQWTCVTANVIAMLANRPLKQHKEGATWMKLPPMVLIGHGPKGYGFLDFNNVPPPIKCCCCWGLGGFPCCPPCWPCCACGGCGCCPCGVCCGQPEGKGPATFAGVMAFKSSGFHFKGMGEAPSQQVM